MINIKELLDDLVETGITKEEALAEVRKTFNRRDRNCKKENVKFAKKREAQLQTYRQEVK